MTAKPRRKTPQAPTGRNISAQGNALGNAIPEDQSPEPERSGNRSPTGDRAAVNEVNQRARRHSDLLARVLSERRATWKGRGQYKEPVAAETANLPHLPDGWVWASLDQLFLNITDGDHLPPPQTSAGVPFVVIGDVRSGKLDLSDTRFVAREYADAVDAFRKPRKGDILYTLVGSFGLAIRVATEDEFCIQRHIAVLRPHSLSPVDYLAHVLNSPTVFSHASSVATGTAQKTVPLAGLRRIPVPLPPPDDQRRIVAEIEKQFTRLEAGVAALRRVQANLKRYRAAVLKAACEGRLVPTEAELARAEGRPFESGQQLLARILTERRQNWQGRGKYKEPLAPDIKNVGQLAESWVWASVDQLADETMIGLDRGRDQQSLDPETGVPYIKMNNVTMDGRVHCDDLVFVPASREEAERYALRDGDILFNTRNSKELVGKVGLVRCPPPGAVYNNNLMRIRLPEGVLPAFLALQMCSQEFRQRMELVKKATTSVAAVYAKDLLPLAIALPPLAEQTRIVAEVERRMSVVEELEAVVTTNLQRATRLRQSILQKAFAGELIDDEKL